MLDNLSIDQIPDPLVRENFRKIRDLVNQLTIINAGIQHRIFAFEAAGTFLIKHNLPFRPLDAWTTGITAGTATWNYGSFTETDISVTVTTACTIRAFIGRYNKGA